MSLWIVIFPFDVVKSRMQIHQTKLSMMSLLLKISRDEGMTHYFIYLLLSPDLVSKCLICMAHTYLADLS